jgi:hypothetical protein
MRTSHLRTIVVLALVLCFYAAPCGAQGSDAGSGWRLGITFGGISTFGVTYETYRDGTALEVPLGTFAFRDLGVAVSGKQYFGGRAARPFAGLGLWAIVASSDPRSGLGLVARMPLGLDWNVHDRHSVGTEIAINRALAVRRPDPEDDRPLNRRLVPLPGIYYRVAP